MLLCETVLYGGIMIKCGQMRGNTVCSVWT